MDADVVMHDDTQEWSDDEDEEERMEEAAASEGESDAEDASMNDGETSGTDESVNDESASQRASEDHATLLFEEPSVGASPQVPRKRARRNSSIAAAVVSHNASAAAEAAAGRSSVARPARTDSASAQPDRFIKTQGLKRRCRRDTVAHRPAPHLFASESESISSLAAAAATAATHRCSEEQKVSLEDAVTAARCVQAKRDLDHFLCTRMHGLPEWRRLAELWRAVAARASTASHDFWWNLQVREPGGVQSHQSDADKLERLAQRVYPDIDLIARTRAAALALLESIGVTAITVAQIVKLLRRSVLLRVRRELLRVSHLFSLPLCVAVRPVL
ncbi:MAG: hypothetical protein Q7T57_05135 [Dehalococcoidales bacterium]|nr:hypothetical protein [Dehalococcoidales bacterium]